MDSRSKLTSDVADAFCAEIRRGQPVTFAAAIAKVSRASVFAWLAKGKADEKADVPPGFGEGESRERELLDRYVCARAQLGGEIADAIRNVRTGPGERVPSALAYFERTRFPAEFGDAALAEQVRRELAEEAPPPPGWTPARMARCPSCGEDQLATKPLCGDCGKPMASPSPTVPREPREGETAGALPPPAGAHAGDPGDSDDGDAEGEP